MTCVSSARLSEVQDYESTLLLVWKGEKHLIKLTAHDEVAHSTWNSALMQTVKFIDECHFTRVVVTSFSDTKEAEKSAHKVAALYRKRSRLSSRIKKPLKNDRVLGKWQTDLCGKVVSDIRLNLAAGDYEH